MPKISIHIVTWNSAHVIERCLLSLQNQTETDTTIVIVDNASSDNTIQIIRNCAPKATVIRNATNLGFARAHNQALRLSKTEYVLIANADVFLDVCYLEECLVVLEKHARIGAVQGKLLRMPEHDVPDTVQEIVKRATVLDSTGIMRKRWWEFYDRGSNETDALQYDEQEKIFGTTGALSLLRRRALEMITHESECFDELFHSYKEDVDIALRLKKAGWLSVYVPSARAIHIRTAAATSQNAVSIRKTERAARSPHERYMSYRNHLYILFKHLTLGESFLYGPWIIVYELKKVIYAFLFEPKLLTAWLEVIRMIPKLLKKRSTRVPRRNWV